MVLDGGIMPPVGVAKFSHTGRNMTDRQNVTDQVCWRCG